MSVLKKRYDSKTDADIKKILAAKDYDRLTDDELIRVCNCVLIDSFPVSFVQHVGRRLESYYNEITGG
jgi:hypothetical protein